jgi:hypothetical protein
VPESRKIEFSKKIPGGQTQALVRPLPFREALFYRLGFFRLARSFLQAFGFLVLGSSEVANYSRRKRPKVGSRCASEVTPTKGI